MVSGSSRVRLGLASQQLGMYKALVKGRFAHRPTCIGESHHPELCWFKWLCPGPSMLPLSHESTQLPLDFQAWVLILPR